MLEYTNMHILSDTLISEATKQDVDVPCQLQMFMEMEALNRSGVQTQTKPLFISCPCKRYSPFTL